MRCKFELERRKDKGGNVVLTDMPIRFVVTFKGERITFFSGYRIDTDKWNDVKQRVEGKSVNRKGVTPEIINKRLADMENVISQYELHCAANRENPAKDELKERMAIAVGKEAKQGAAVRTKTFLDIFDTFLKESGSDWSVATHKKLAVVRNHLAEFSPELSFDQFTDKGLTAYITFLREKKQMRNSTVAKQLGILKWFLRWATVNGYNTNTAFQSFKPPLKKPKNSEKKVIFLTWDELMTVYNFDIPESKEYLARVRDVFCFCCFTSLRYSDVHNLKRIDIKGDVLDITTVKTSDRLIIELNKYSKAILAKYEGLPFAQNKALPVISNQIIT